MKQVEFQLLSLSEMIEVLYEHGVYIGKRREDNKSVLLYQLDSFYVEVYYRKYRCFVEKVNCFSSMALLDPYLEEMDLEHLVFLQ